MANYIEFDKFNLQQLASHGFLRWGHEPVKNLFLMPKEKLKFVRPGTTLTGIDGNPYVVGTDAISEEEIHGYLAYGFLRVPSCENLQK